MSRRASDADDWRAWGDEPYDYGYDGFPIEGVSVEFVCDKIPVVTLDRSSPFDEYASWMLQGALGVTGKATGTYDHFHDEEITEECFRLGYRDQDICMVRCREQEHRHIAAVGVSGKRSVMLAVVIAACLDDPDNEMEELWTGLIHYKLNKKFDAILQFCKSLMQQPTGESRSVSDPVAIDDDDPEEEIEGVTIRIVHGNVPVVSMDKGSVFDECASWMLQIAADSMSKATGLYDYAYDEDIMQELFKRGYSEQDVVLARMKPRNLADVYAAGATGKRSVMLALCVSLIIQKKISPESFANEARQYQHRLEDPCRELADLALRITEQPHSKGHGRWSRSEPPGRRKFEFHHRDDVSKGQRTRDRSQSKWPKQRSRSERSRRRKLEFQHRDDVLKRHRHRSRSEHQRTRKLEFQHRDDVRKGPRNEIRDARLRNR